MNDLCALPIGSKRRGGAVLLLVWFLAAVATAGQEGTPDEADWQEMKGGLRFLDLKVGDGDEARSGKLVTVHYVGRLPDGTVFDSSRERGKSLVFRLGDGSMIQGWERGMKGMRVGGIRKLDIPPKLGYGKRGIKGRIPPNTPLDFEIELLAVTR